MLPVSVRRLLALQCIMYYYTSASAWEVEVGPRLVEARFKCDHCTEYESMLESMGEYGLELEPGW